MNQNNKAYLQLHLAIFFWGFTGVLGRAIELSAPLIVGYRMLFTALILAGIITFFRKWQKISISDFKRMYFIGVLFAIHWVAFYMSIKLAGASIAMICLATASIFTAIFNPLFTKTKIHLSEILIGAMALIGVLVMYLFQKDSGDESISINESGSNYQLGIILGVVAAIISAIFTIFNKPLTQKYDSRLMVFHEMSAGMLFLLVLSPYYFSEIHSGKILPEGWDYLWIFCLVYFCTVLGQQLVLKALKSLNPFVVTLSVNIEPIYGIILAFVIYKENLVLNWSFYVGMSIIMISLIWQVWLGSSWRKRMKAKLHTIDINE